MPRRQRQAVIFIHGIGDQRPMGSLRAFLDNIGLGAYWSKPDRLSGSFELRRFALPRTRSRPATDFFELYWAHHFEDGEIRQTLAWAARLVFKRPFWALNRTLRPVIGMLQVFSGLLVLLALWLLVRALLSAELATLWESWQAYAAAVLLVVNVLLGRFVRTSLADAARYLTPRPANVNARNAIRHDGVTLLRRLHTSGNFERVVIVGHSLGSVIGYDIVRYVWDEMRTPDVSRAGRQPAARAFDAGSAALGEPPGPAEVEAFQEAQHRLWRENRSRGVPWLVTDFITLGSPLAHADLILTDRHVTLERRQLQREYPTCPPVIDERDGSSMYQSAFSADGVTRSFLVGHHGAPFGPTRWTNLYFPVSHLVMGDLVGGPLAPLFGPGVRDVAVRPGGRGRWKQFHRRLFPFSHSAYWRAAPEGSSSATARRRQDDRRSGTREAAATLRAALALDTERAGHQRPDAEPAATTAPASATRRLDEAQRT